MLSDEQKEYWDAESSGDYYCTNQLKGLLDLSVLEMVDAALNRNKTVPRKILEIGGGSQYISRHLCRRFPGATIICTDLSETRVELFRQYYKDVPSNLTVMSGVDAKNLPFETGEFDLIVGDAMLHHIDFLKPALFEIRRCLSPQGYAIFVREPIIGFLGKLIYRYFQYTQHARSSIEINYYEYKRMLSQWQYEFMMAGFSVRTLKFYKNQSLSWKLRALFPHLTPCYLSFILQGKIDIEGIKGRL